MTERTTHNKYSKVRNRLYSTILAGTIATVLLLAILGPSSALAGISSPHGITLAKVCAPLDPKANETGNEIQCIGQLVNTVEFANMDTWALLGDLNDDVRFGAPFESADFLFDVPVIEISNTIPINGSYTGTCSVGDISDQTPCTVPFLDGLQFNYTYTVFNGVGTYTDQLTAPVRDLCDFTGEPGTCNDEAQDEDRLGQFTINPAMPNVTTVSNVTGTKTINFGVKDTATLSGGFFPTGTINFTLFKDDTKPIDCSAENKIHSELVAVDGNGNYMSSGVLITMSGNYSWVASYSGDGNNTEAVNSCNEETESFMAMEPLGMLKISKLIEEIEMGEGCTPGFWKNNADKKGAVAWPEGFSPDDTLSDIGIVNDIGVNVTSITLIQALNFGGGETLEDAERNLLKHAVAAILNAANDDVNYDLTVAEIVEMVNEALASDDRDTILDLKDELDDLNNQLCPINQKGKRTVDDPAMMTMDGTFEFESDTPLGNFSITTEDGMGMTAKINLTAGIYNVTEIVPDGWSLTNAECDDASPPSAIDIAQGEFVTCTFTNKPNSE